MARWNRTCYEFKEVREIIKSGENYCDILDRLQKICAKYAKEDWLFASDFDDLGVDIDCAIYDRAFEDQEVVDFYLSEFYDLCDCAGVWLSL